MADRSTAPVRDRRRTPVDHVTVVLLTHPGGPLVDSVLDDLARQHRLPDRVVITGLPEDDEEVRRVPDHPLLEDRGVPLTVRPALSSDPGGAGTGAALADALTVILPGPGADADPDAAPDAARAAGRWVWVLHDDSEPAPRALEHLVAATRRSSGVAAVAPKLVRAGDPRVLAALGHRLSPAGRLLDPWVDGQADQGQFDDRADTLGAPLAGLLLREDALVDVGGVERAFDGGAQGLDLCWRLQLAGHRVVLAPRAVLAQGTAGLPPLDATTRRRVRQLALARGPLWSQPWRSLTLLVGLLVTGLVLLVRQRPRQALGEWSDALAALTPGRGLAARWRFRGRRRVRHRDLQGLFETRASAWRGTVEATPRPVPALAARAEPARARSLAEPGPVSDEALSLGPARATRWWSWPLVLAFLLTVGATAARWRELLPSAVTQGVTGGELSGTSARASDLWASATQAWDGAGLGGIPVERAWTLPVAGLTWLVEQVPVDPSAQPATVATTLLLLAAGPLSCVGAYLACRIATTARWPRAVAGLVWAGAAPLPAALSEGRVGPAVAHVLLPLALAGVVLAFTPATGRRGTSAVFGSALALGVAGAFVPLLLVLALVLAVALALLGPGWGRLRALVLGVVPPALQGPWLADVVTEPRLLLGGPGATTVDAPPPDWQLALLHPGGVLSPTLWWWAPILALAVLALARPGAPGRRVSVLAGTGLLGLLLALASPRVSAGPVAPGYTEAGAAVTAWPGTALSVLAAAALLAAAHLIDPARDGLRSVSATAGLRVATGVAALAGVATLGWGTVAGGPGTLQPATPLLPAAIAQQARGPEAMRVLELGVSAAGVDYRVSGREPGPWVRDRVGELVADASAAGPVAAGVAGAGPQELVARTVADVASETGPGADPWTTHRALHDLAVGYVVLDAPPEHALVGRLDATAGLTRVETGAGGSPAPDPGRSTRSVWRVMAAGEDPLVSVARVRLVDAEGEPVLAVPVDGAHATTTVAVDAPPDAVALLVSEPAAWSQVARVVVDGVERDPVPGWPVRYLLGSPPETISVQLPDGRGAWWLGVGILAVLVAVFAVPLRDRRPR